MVIGITMIKVRPGHEKSVDALLMGIEGVKEVYHLFGEFDFLVVMQAERSQLLSRLTEKIRRLGEVTEIWKMLITRDDDLLPSETHLQAHKSCVQEGYIQKESEPALG
jgi:nitrate reductase NapAB chaperone NapD